MTTRVNQRFRLPGLVIALALAVTALPAHALDATPSHVFHPFGFFQVEWNSNVTGQDTGDSLLRAAVGSTYRYQHPGGTSLTVQYRGQFLAFPQLTALSNVAHIGTAMVAHRLPVGQMADWFTPYLGVQVLHHTPTGTLGGPGRTDGDYFLGFSFLKRWQPSHLFYYGAHLDYFGAGVPAAAFWGASLNLGYRWTPSALLQLTASNRVHWRLPIDPLQANTVRDSLVLDLDVFPVVWLQVGPRLGVHYETGVNAWSWTAGMTIGSNLWWTR